MPKVSIFSFLILFSVLSCFSQKIQIKSLDLDNPDLKIVYIGYDNHFQIIGQNLKNLEFKCNRAKIYVLSKDSIVNLIIRSEANIDINPILSVYFFKHEGNKVKIVDSIQFSVRKICDQFRLTYPGYSRPMSIVEYFLNQDKFHVERVGEHWNRGFKIFDYKIMFVFENERVTLNVNDDRITPLVKRYIKRLKSGDCMLIWFTGESYPYSSIPRELPAEVICIDE
jgi:hypothetical protein